MPRSDQRLVIRRNERRRLVAAGALAMLQRLCLEERDLEPRGRHRGQPCAVTDGSGSVGGCDPAVSNNSVSLLGSMGSVAGITDSECQVSL